METATALQDAPRVVTCAPCACGGAGENSRQQLLLVQRGDDAEVLDAKGGAARKEQRRPPKRVARLVDESEPLCRRRRGGRRAAPDVAQRCAHVRLVRCDVRARRKVFAKPQRAVARIARTSDLQRKGRVHSISSHWQSDYQHEKQRRCFTGRTLHHTTLSRAQGGTSGRIRLLPPAARCSCRRAPEAGQRRRGPAPRHAVAAPLQSASARRGATPRTSRHALDAARRHHGREALAASPAMAAKRSSSADASTLSVMYRSSST
eukprot:6214196-Pleurochrysis_carterae.AAC.2